MTTTLPVMDPGTSRIANAPDRWLNTRASVDMPAGSRRTAARRYVNARRGLEGNGRRAKGWFGGWERRHGPRGRTSPGKLPDIGRRLHGGHDHRHPNRADQVT